MPGNSAYRVWRRLVVSLALVLVAAACGGDSRVSVAIGNTDGLPRDLPGDAAEPVLERAFAQLAFSQPVFLLQAPSDASRWYLLEKGGAIFRFANDPQAFGTELFADLAPLVESAPGEAGLLGMAFHPAFAQNGEVFVSYTAPPASADFVLESRISRFRSPDGGLSLDLASEQILLRLDQPFANHNGGHIAFGPDGFLYLGFGDGGSGGDPLGNGQNTQTLPGALLRIDVDGAVPYAIPPTNPFAAGGGRAEIFAFGLRNPWRWSFDRANGDLWLGDVGQNQWEEIDRIVSGGNYGWNIREGAHCFESLSCETAGLIDPVAEYSHAEGCSVTGGYVYRGAQVPALFGTYVYGDFCSGRVWGLPAAGTEPGVLFESGLNLSSFAEDGDGELFLLDFTSGGIFRIIAIP